MKERLLQFLRSENKTAAQFAEEIDVQPSGISHILSGRNNPSLDFVLKMLETYDYISTEWLLFGKGNMYKDEEVQKIADDSVSITEDVKASEEVEKEDLAEKKSITTKEMPPKRQIHSLSDKEVEKIVWFYSDNSFEEFFPEKE